MRQVLGEFHPDFAYHEQPGAGHWWGNPCVDWPPLFAFLGGPHDSRAGSRCEGSISSRPARRCRPAHTGWRSRPSSRRFCPARCISSSIAKHRRFRGTTENVARLAIDVGRALPDCEGRRTDSRSSSTGRTMPPFPAFPQRPTASASIWLVRTGGTWSVSQSPPLRLAKRPARQGPFKEAFRNRFILVFGTKGTPEENAWSLARARFDAETFWYRGNGSVDIVSDATFLDLGRAA